MKDDDLPITVNVGDVDMSMSVGVDSDWEDLFTDTTIDFAREPLTLTSPVDASGATTVTIDAFDDYNFTLNPKEFVDYMPGPDKIKSMCKEYPALDEAWKNFRTMYEMVHQDWLDNSEDAPPF